MKYLKRFNESKKFNPTFDEFINELSEELKHIGFKIVVEKPDLVYSEGILEINDMDNGTYIDFDLENFSIENLKKECSKILDELSNGYRDWDIFQTTDDVKDGYDLLCTSILTFIDMKNYGEIENRL